MSADATQRRATASAWARVVLVLAFAGLVALPALAYVAWVGFAGGELGWVPSLLAFGGLGFVVGWLAVPSRWPTARAGTSIGLAVAGGLVGLAVAHLAPPNEARLRSEIEELEQPTWRLRTETTSGGALCFDYCTEVTRVYDVPSRTAAVLEEVAPALERHGLRRVSERGPVVFGEDGSGGGDTTMTVTVESGDGELTTIRITARAD
jgi:hypothetical protein